jgi:hypothetical protein
VARRPSGSDPLREWKLFPAAKLCVDEARLSGKWVHVGRVKLWRRLEFMASRNVDSVDGTYLAFGPTPTAGGWPGGQARRLPWLRGDSIKARWFSQHA